MLINQQNRLPQRSNNVTYREALCTKDDKGVKFFSPLCDPNFRNSNLRNGSQSQQTFSKVHVDDCSVTPLIQPSPQVPQFTDKASAFDWFKDPTYAQRVSARKHGIRRDILETNPSLRMYHRLKSKEKFAGSLIQTS
jgi:hypothetical protein